MSRTRWIAACAAATLALAVPGLSTAAQAAPGDGHNGYGYVRDTYNGNHVDGVTVAARSGTASGAIVETTVTGSGRFDFDDLPEGPIYLQFTDPSGKVESRTNGPFRVDRADYQFGDVYLETYRGLLTGTVSQSDGSDPCGYLEVYRADNAASSMTSIGLDDDYFSSWLPVGAYKLKFRSYCDSRRDTWLGGTDHSSATSRVISKNATTSFGAFVLPVPVSITGTVRSEGGNAALENISVQARTATDDYVAEVQTKANGTYRLTDLAPGSYVLRFTDNEGEFQDEYYNNSPTHVGAETITLGSSTVTGKDVSLAKAPVIDEPTVSVKGVVTNFAGKGLNDIEVELFNIGQNKWVGSSSYTNRNGAYSFHNIEPGTYRIEFDDDGDSSQRPEYFDRRITVAVGSTRLTVPTVKLVGEATISGRLSLSATSAPHEMWGRVSAWDIDGNEVDSTSINRNGTYELDELAPGTYKLRFEGEREFFSSYERMISQWWSGKYTMTSANVLTVGDSAVRTGVNVTLGRSLVATAAPRVTGTAKQGKTLRASAGTWNAIGGTTFTYQWFRNGKAISRATKPSYKLAKADVRKKVSVKVTASNRTYGWTAGAKFSASTPKVVSSKKVKKKKKK